MKLLLLMTIISISLSSFGQSKKEIIDGLMLDQKNKSATIDSLKIANQQLKRSLISEQETSKEFRSQVTKLNFETADLRLVMYEHVASIDSLTRLLEDKSHQYEMMKQSYNQCKKDKEVLLNSIRSKTQEETTNTNDLNTDQSSINAPRTIMNKLNTQQFNAKEKATFKFVLTVNESGKVTDVELVAKNCSDSNLQEKVIQEIKNQLRYNAVTGTGVVRIKYSCSIDPS